MTADRPMIVISSDGHACARMADYRPYLPSEWHERFDEFVKVYEERGSLNTEAPALSLRTDPDIVEAWVRDVLEPGRLGGLSDGAERLKEMEREGFSGEILFPDFGIPFELYSPFMAKSLGYPQRTLDEIDVGNRAYNRWLADQISIAPERFCGQAVVRFDDVEAAMKEIRWAKEAGLGGVVLPVFDTELPAFDPKFDPIWSLLEELDMPANGHIISTGIGHPTLAIHSLPHPTTGFPLFLHSVFHQCRGMLAHMIWGGVLERHPNLKFVMTEMQSGWVIEQLAAWDYSYEGSYLKRDIQEALSVKPSEYFARQCYIGSSVLSKAEVDARELIGVEKMMFGVDYPHHEGAWNGGTIDYIQATFGAAKVPENEARLILGGNAGEVFGFDMDALSKVADTVGPRPSKVLTPPATDLFPRGDVHRPLD
jgi:predicted TIM-barrel fold metal-dependent hydrolase